MPLISLVIELPAKDLNKNVINCIIKKVIFMDITLIGILFVLIIGAVFIFFLTHKILKVILFVIGFCFFISIILGVFIFLDAKQFQEKMENNNILFILLNGDKPIALIPVGNGAKDLMISEQETINSKIINNNYKDLTKDYFKLLFIDIKLLSSIKEENFEQGSFKITKEQAYQALISDDPFRVLGLNENNVPADLTVPKLKMTIFMITMQKQIMENPVFLLKEFKAGNIKVYKETIMFRFIRYIPTSVVEKLINKGETKLKIGE